MQPLRGYDSLSLGNLLQGIAPAPLSPVDVQNTEPYDSAQSPIVPQRRSSLTQERFLALKQAMRRIAPHVPPDVLQRHYINRLSELSNPTADTLYPAASHDSPPPSDDTSGGFYTAPQFAQSAQSAMASPFVQEAMARFAENARRHVQPISEEDARLSTGDLRNSIRTEPLSAPDIMEDPIVAARARSVGPVADRYVAVDAVPFSTADPASDAVPLPSTKSNTPNGHGETETRYWENSPKLWEEMIPGWGTGKAAFNDFNSGNYASGARKAATALGELTNPGIALGQAAVKRSAREPTFAESLLPLWGPAVNGLHDLHKGDYLWALINAGLFAADATGLELLSEPAKGAFYGLRYGIPKAIPKALEKSGVGEQLKAGYKTVKQELSEQLRGYWKLGSHDAGNTREWYARYLNSTGKALPDDMPVHHYIVPQRMGWLLPKWLFNQPWNLLPLTRASELGVEPRVLHNALHGWKKDEYVLDKGVLQNLRKQYEYGTPDWAKRGIPAALMSAGGNTAEIENALRSPPQR
jgi:hypothetical protein